MFDWFFNKKRLKAKVDRKENHSLVMSLYRDFNEEDGLHKTILTIKHKEGWKIPTEEVKLIGFTSSTDEFKNKTYELGFKSKHPIIFEEAD